MKAPSQVVVQPWADEALVDRPRPARAPHAIQPETFPGMLPRSHQGTWIDVTDPADRTRSGRRFRAFDPWTPVAARRPSGPRFQGEQVVAVREFLTLKKLSSICDVNH